MGSVVRQESGFLGRRTHYLKHLGVSAWYARKVLPGALPTPASVLVQADERNGVAANEVVESAPAILETERINPMELLESKQTLEEKPKDLASPAVPAQSDINTSEKVSTGAKAEFRLRLFLFENVIVTTLTDSNIPEPGELPLLKNMLFATFKDHMTPILSESFEWPVFRHQELQSSFDLSSLDLLKVWFSKFEELSNPSYHLHFGGEGSTNLQEFFRQNSQVGSTKKYIEFPFTLSSLLNNYENKKTCWRILSSQVLNAVP